MSPDGDRGDRLEVTVCTLTRDRTSHLVNQVFGLLRSARPPAAHVVAVMGGEDPRARLPATPWETRFVAVDDGGELPLARARNVAVVAAETEGVVLLDVDCIPATSLVGSYAEALERLDGILMGGVRYLPPDWPDEIAARRQARHATAARVPPCWTDADLHEVAERHPSRPEPPVPGEIRRELRYELFWSLSFAVRRSTMIRRVGGFDEGYTGYGAEDTDFALRARRADVPLAWLGGASAYHQHHDTYDPPLQHAASIVTNARRFHEVWGRWPMEGWLARFAEVGVVRWDPAGDVLELLREPTQEELVAAHRPTAVPREERSRP